MKKKANHLLSRRVVGGSFALALLLVLMSTAYQPQRGGFMLKNVQAVTSGAEYSMPIWSPNGQQLLVSSTHGMKLHLLDLKTQKVQQLSDGIGSGFDASWSADGKEVYFRYKADRQQVHPEIKAIELAGRKIKGSSLNPNGLLSASKAQASKDVVVFINLETLAIQAQTKDGAKSWDITHDEGQYYRPLLSPDQKHVLVHSGSEMLLYAADGSGYIKSFGTGLAGSWSPDGKHIVAFLDSSDDGHAISGSELYMIDVERGEMAALTATQDVYELWPSWSADGKQIAYEDARTGIIYIADIVQQ